MHGGFKHLLDNSIPLVVVGTAMLYLYPKSSLRVLPVVYIGPGIAVWLFAKGGVHIGASGLVYGLVAYVFVAGLIRHDRRAIAASMLVAFMYGALAWGVTPIQAGMSWETHLAAALIGAAMAVWLRHIDVPPRVRYDWEGETGNDYDGEAVRTDDEWPGTTSAPTRRNTACCTERCPHATRAAARSARSCSRPDPAGMRSPSCRP